MSTAAVKQLKEDLVKELPAESDQAVDRCRDILARLDATSISLQILADTMIGKTVAQLKSHESLGSTAKALVKKWKQVAKSSSGGRNTTTQPPPSSGSAAAATNLQRRTSLSDEPPEDFTNELIGLSVMRQNICKKLLEVFQNCKADLVRKGVSEEAIIHLLGPRALELEACINKCFPDKKGYTDKARSLAFNLKKNKGLMEDVILGQLGVDTLVAMSSEELASDEMLKKRQEEAKKLIDSKRLDWDQANEAKINEMCGIKGDLLKASLFTCGRCKSVKTTSTQKQTRSADE